MIKQLVPWMVGAMILAPVYGRSEASGTNTTALPDRSQIPSEAKWHLDHMYPSLPAWQQEVDSLKPLLAQAAAYRGTLSSSPQQLLNCLALRDEIGQRSGKLFAYARMQRDENTADNNAQALTGKMEGLLAESSAALSFIDPEILSMPDADLQALRNQEAQLARYDFYFDNLLRQKQHVLSPQEEALLARSAEIAQAPETIFNMLAHADMTFPAMKDEKGHLTQLSEGRYSLFIRSPQRAVRQQAFTGLFDSYRQYRNTFAATLNSNVKKNIFYADSRHYPSARAASLFNDNIPLPVYDNLIDTVTNNLAPLHRYVSIKGRALGVEQMHMYDLYAPLVSDVSLHYSYAEGRKLVQQALFPLGNDYGVALSHGLDSGWVDVYETKGKQTGAYSWGVYGVHPYVLLNYQDRYEDVSTLAHEMGHALHSYYSNERQPFATSSYTTFCAEVASTTNEILLLEHMLDTSKDPKVRLYLLNQYLEQVRTTVYRQTLFAEFEKEIHEKSQAGETLTADLLSSLWRQLNIKYYGPNIVVDKEIDMEWARIPHFYYNFYVYQYVTGYSAATALADGLRTQGPEAQKRYLAFLASGGSDYPITLLRNAGVDMSAPQPIELTLKKFAERLNEFETLLNAEKK